jgi:hypothetical protein
VSRDGATQRAPTGRFAFTRWHAEIAACVVSCRSSSCCSRTGAGAAGARVRREPASAVAHGRDVRRLPRPDVRARRCRRIRGAPSSCRPACRTSPRSWRRATRPLRRRRCIVFPEDVGLVAGLIGSRGALARQVTADTGGSTLAFLALTVAYQPLVEHYSEEFPGLPGLAYLFLGATDTYYRAFYETFRDLAVTYGVYVAASANVAPARRVEAATDPALVALLRDPDEPDRQYAYEAVEGRPVNTLFHFRARRLGARERWQGAAPGAAPLRPAASCAAASTRPT